MSRPKTAIRGYQDLEVWQRAMDLAVECCTATKMFPSDERYGLTAQVKRSAASVPSNIAEGRGRLGIGGFLNHLSIAKGSLFEVETQLLLAIRLGYLHGQTADALVKRTTQVACLLAGLIRALKAKQGSAKSG
jgi:four helix bundle protein